MYKVCSMCQIEKSIDNFYSHKSSKGGRRSYCKQCHKDKMSGWNKENVDRKREMQLKRNFNMTLEDYNNILERQGGCCGICGSNENISGGRSIQFAVDHCHTSQRIRGLLCTKCNRSLGQLGDTYDSILKVLKYLETH